MFVTIFTRKLRKCKKSSYSISMHRGEKIVRIPLYKFNYSNVKTTRSNSLKLHPRQNLWNVNFLWNYFYKKTQIIYLSVWDIKIVSKFYFRLRIMNKNRLVSPASFRDFIHKYILPIPTLICSILFMGRYQNYIATSLENYWYINTHNWTSHLYSVKCLNWVFNRVSILSLYFIRANTLNSI